MTSFLHNFAESRHLYFQEMTSLHTVNYLSIEHTFKVAANIGYLRPDERWITQYNSLLIVLKNIGQVIAQQFTGELKRLYKGDIHHEAGSERC